MTNTLKKSFLALIACLSFGSLQAVTIYESDLKQTGTGYTTSGNGSYSTSVPSWGEGSSYWKTTSSTHKTTLTFSPAIDLSGYSNVRMSIKWGHTSSNKNMRVYVNNSEITSTVSGSLNTPTANTLCETVVAISGSSINTIAFQGQGSSGLCVFHFTITGDGGGGQTTPTVSSVTVAPTSVTLDPNDTQQLTATVNVTPSTADKSVSWASSNPSVATVSTSGLVTAVAQGTATITATSTLDNTKSGSCVVTVNAPAAPIPVTAISLNKSTTTIAIGGNETLTVNYTPANANTGKAVSWTSSNNSIATVDNSGKVTGVAAGTATITATSTTDNTITASCSVTVQAVAVTGVSVNPTTASVQVSSTTTLTANVLPANATNKSVTWSTSDASIATVNNGVVTGVATGTATITATTVDGGKTATCTVTVSAAATIPPTDLTLHEPGVYEDKQENGGYSTNLVLYGQREYEIYYPGKTDKTSYASFCTMPNTQKMDGITNNTSATYTKAQDGWFEVSLNGGISNCSVTATNEFPAASTNVYFKMTNNNSFKCHIKGFDQFSFLGKDKKTDTSSKQDKPENNQLFEVYIDNVLQPAKTNTSSVTLRRYDISTGEHVIEVRAINGGNSEFYGFSLREAQAPHTKYLKGNDSTQVVMQTMNIRPITYYTKYNSFGETRLEWSGNEATGITLQTRGSDAVGDTLVVSGTASCPVGVYNYSINTYYNNVLTGSIPGKIEVQSDIKALTATYAEGFQGMSIDDINFTYHALSADDITLTWANNNAPGGITGSGANGMYSLSGSPQNKGTFIYTVTVLGGNSITDTIVVHELVIGDNPVLYLYKNNAAYQKDGVYQYLTSSAGGSYNLIPLKATKAKRSADQYNLYTWIIISEDVDADNQEVIQLIRDGINKPILNLKGFTYGKDSLRLGWGDPNNGAIDSKTPKSAGCKISLERSSHPIFTKLSNKADGREIHILDNYEKNGVMTIDINNMPSNLTATCLATAHARGAEYYEEGAVQSAIHEIPKDQRGGGKYICFPLARQVTLSPDGKRLIDGIVDYLKSPTQATVQAPELRITKFTVEGIDAAINETEKTIQLQITETQFHQMDDLRKAKPVITLADPSYTHVTPGSGEEVDLQYSYFLSQSYVVTDFVNRVVYEFNVKLVNPQGIEEVYEAGQWVNIYDIYGRKVATTNEDVYAMDLPHGMYIIVTENGSTLKIMR